MAFAGQRCTRKGGGGGGMQPLRSTDGGVRRCRCSCWPNFLPRILLVLLRESAPIVLATPLQYVAIHRCFLDVCSDGSQCSVLTHRHFCVSNEHPSSSTSPSVAHWLQRAHPSGTRPGITPRCALLSRPNIEAYHRVVA
jgi:hypothetical protein